MKIDPSRSIKLYSSLDYALIDFVDVACPIVLPSFNTLTDGIGCCYILLNRQIYLPHQRHHKLNNNINLFLIR